MIGVTIASNDFEELAIEAAKRFRKHTGIQKTIIVSTQYEKNYKEKLALYKLLNQGETIVFFDSDLWFINDVDLFQFEDRIEFIGCHDPGCKPEYVRDHFPYKDCITFGIDPDKYFNGGLFIFNERHIPAFQYAEKLMASLTVKRGMKFIDGKPLADFGEQSSLNYAMMKHNIPVDILSSRFNFMPFAVYHVGAEAIDNPFTIHAAGYGDDPNFPDQSAGEMKRRALLGYEYKYKSGRKDFYSC